MHSLRLIIACERETDDASTLKLQVEQQHALKMLEKQHALKIPQNTVTRPCKEEQNRHTLEKIS
jgi:hypothetical protein